MKIQKHRDAAGVEWRLHAFGQLPVGRGEVALVVVDGRGVRFLEQVGTGDIRTLSGKAAMGAVRWFPLIKGEVRVAVRQG